MSNSFKYLVFDIESITNKSLLNKVVYAGENLTDDQAYQKQMEELAKDGKNFVNIAFHQPVALAAVAVAEDFSVSKIGLLGGNPITTKSIVGDFWEMYNKNKPILIDFNGNGYDIRLLELWAFQLGIPIGSRHFAKFGPRYRYSFDQHIDLQDFLNNNGSVSYKGGLNLFSKLLGKPGKMETKGEMVQEMYEKNKFFEINDYCLGDTMDTYFVFLRTRVMIGELTLTREQELVDQAKIKIEEHLKKEGHLKNYLANFGKWEACG